MRSLNKRNLKVFGIYSIGVVALFASGYGLAFTNIAQFTNLDWGHGLMAIVFHTLLLVAILMVAYVCLRILFGLVNFIYPKV